MRRIAGAMTTEHSGSGDPAKSLELMWGVQPRPTRGPKPTLTVPRIVAAAIAVADAEGLTAMSIRRVAQELGAGAMSLYRYLPGRAELVDLMVDTVYGELPRVVVRGTWRARLEAVARENRTLYLRHPWLLQVAAGRPVLGPNTMAKYEYELAAVEGIGLSDLEMDAVVTLLNGFVGGAVRGAVDAAQAERQSGLTDEQWWQAHQPLLEKVFDIDRFPLAARVGGAVGAELNSAYDPDHAFEFGLARVLDGISALLADR
ncbi:MAG TPA: TetR/AcrR family transcriptional regulator C-terminal domain-containing protein [Kribbellaceae bacterium]|nr:TetR/AcrR family transcriptional regulator C-terminal domain-containing protein [Kribbellaceae bacterium]